jgi:hypothetical protein
LCDLVISSWSIPSLLTAVGHWSLLNRSSVSYAAECLYIFLDMYIYFNIPTHGKHARRKSQALCFWPLFCANAWRHRGHLNGSTHLSLSFGPCLSVSEASWWMQSTSWFSLGNMFDWPPAQVHVLRDTAWVFAHVFLTGFPLACIRPQPWTGAGGSAKTCYKTI